MCVIPTAPKYCQVHPAQQTNPYLMAKSASCHKTFIPCHMAGPAVRSLWAVMLCMARRAAPRAVPSANNQNAQGSPNYTRRAFSSSKETGKEAQRKILKISSGIAHWPSRSNDISSFYLLKRTGLLWGRYSLSHSEQGAGRFSWITLEGL